MINIAKQEKKEAWHKIVVKVICWRSGLPQGGSVKPTDKISRKEWLEYQRSFMRTNVLEGPKKSRAKLRSIEQKIIGFGGFE